MLPDDVFRDRLEQALVDLEALANATRDCAAIDIAASPGYWRMSAVPQMAGACPFELMVKSDQTFSLRIASETYEDEPVVRFDLFLELAKSIVAGRVERIETLNALTDVPLGITTRVELAEGWDWIGERPMTPRPSPMLEAAEERRTHRFLPYRR